MNPRARTPERLRRSFAPSTVRWRLRRLLRRGTLDYFLTERYCLYAGGPRGDVFCADIHHQPWPLQRAEAHITVNTLARAHGIALPDIAPILHFARELDVVAWSLTPI